MRKVHENNRYPKADVKEALAKEFNIAVGRIKVVLVPTLQTKGRLNKTAFKPGIGQRRRGRGGRDAQEENEETGEVTFCSLKFNENSKLSALLATLEFLAA
ncbi:hypothetical protein L596_028921 [Steinernema carpocapsae]|uniref:Uncharacterized protein n=1 Tax=Steinernema carpocapsae TaxID=34508 RepID=A0A4U5LZR9_STECR|nr:hypothetical protein L596_028921 [Steinernema carpocapsae]